MYPSSLFFVLLIAAPLSRLFSRCPARLRNLRFLCPGSFATGFPAKEKAPDRNSLLFLSRASHPDTDTRGATLLLRLYHTLTGIPSYSWQLTYAFTSWNTWPKPFPMPSAVHLLLRFLPGSHLPGLSVSAPATLSPLQRFALSSC